MRLRYSSRATGDLIAIADYLVERSPAGAQAVEAAIRATIDLLLEFPLSGRALAQRQQVRVMPVSRFPYLVFYTVSPDDLLILHIRHGARVPLKANDI